MLALDRFVVTSQVVLAAKGAIVRDYHDWQPVEAAESTLPPSRVRL